MIIPFETRQFWLSFSPAGRLFSAISCESDWTLWKVTKGKKCRKIYFYFWASVVLSEKRGLTSKMGLSLSRNGEAGQHFYKYPCPPREYVCMCIYTLSLRGWVNNFSFLWEMGELFVWGGPPLFTQWAKQTDSRASSYRLAAPRKSWTQKVSCGQQLPFWFESNHTVLSLSFIFSFS
jgi:hypothetical protein